MKIGLAKGLLFYKWQYLWKSFFEGLGVEVIISPNTDKSILKNGINCSIDECCLSFKAFLGHVLYLKDKCDYVLVPRVDNFGKNEKVCVKFNALPDIVKNSIDINVLDYNIDILNKKNEKDAFINMGRRLGFSYKKSLKSYLNACQFQAYMDKMDSLAQIKKLKRNNKKVLIVGHAYNCCDDFIGKPIIDCIKSLNVDVIFAHEFYYNDCLPYYKQFSSGLSWSFSKHLVGAIGLYKDFVDGIIFLSTFPCGPDSLINELMLRNLTFIPVCNLIVDELSELNGLHTRLESFIDILEAKQYAK